MNVLFITDEYLPIPSSNGACVSRVVDSLETAGHTAYVLSVTKNNCENSEKVTYAFYNRTPAPLKNRLFGFCQDDGFVDIICEYAKEIITLKKIDAVVSVCRPVETLIAGIKIKKMFGNINLFGYFLDDLFETELSNGIKTRIVRFNYKRLFNAFLNKAKKGIVLKYYKNTFSRIFSKSKNISYVGLPCVQKQCGENKREDNDIRILYAGSLNASFRNPESVLKILADVKKSVPNMRIQFFSCGCEDILESSRQLFEDDEIEFNGLVSTEKVKELFSSADILLNIANDLPYAVPGKLFEYFSTGKPILNYRFRADDPANEAYSVYPLIYNLYSYKENDISDCAKFISTAQGKQVEFTEIENLFKDSTPQYTARAIIEEI